MRRNGATVMLVAFYNKKALGVRYLETALKRAGYRVVTVFYKDFNSIRPKKTTEQALALLRGQIEKEKPILIGLSVMSSMYLDTVRLVMDTVTKNFTISVVCGGVYATMFPEQLIALGAAYVIRADGERPICMLAGAIRNKTDVSCIPSLYYKANSKVVCNEIGGISADIDAYGLPAVHSENAYFIDRNTLMYGDPQLDTRSYEVVASRGCPFTCNCTGLTFCSGQILSTWQLSRAILRRRSLRPSCTLQWRNSSEYIGSATAARKTDCGRPVSAAGT